MQALRHNLLLTCTTRRVNTGGLLHDQLTWCPLDEVVFGTRRTSDQRRNRRVKGEARDLKQRNVLRSLEQVAEARTRQGTEMVHGRAKAPPRQIWRVALNEVS